MSVSIGSVGGVFVMGYLILWIALTAILNGLGLKLIWVMVFGFLGVVMVYGMWEIAEGGPGDSYK